MPVLLYSLLCLAAFIHRACGAIPVFTSTTTANIVENSAIGTSVHTVAATDTALGIITYSIQTQTPPSPVKFAIASTGVITTTGSIDYETVTSYTLIIRAQTDSDLASSTQTLTVAVTDVNDNTPVFSPNVYYATVQENSAQDTSIMLVTVTDADVADTVTVTIASGDDNASKKFRVDTTNGKLIETSAIAIDYDVLTSTNYKYTLILYGSDGSRTGTATLYVTVTSVNEFSPSWATFSPAYTSATTPYNIPENAAISTTVVTIAATDADAGVDGQILYSLGTVTSNGGSTHTGLFHLDQVSGILTTTSGSFDRDPPSGVEYYDIIVKAIDQGTPKLSSERTVRVGLTDVNDNDPVFSQNIYSITIPETTSASSSILTLTATDKDVTSTLTYTIESSSSPSTYATYFAMDATNPSQLNLKAVVDLDVSGATSTFQLVIMVKDAATNFRSSTTLVTVSITYVNEYDPVFPANITTNVDENKAVGFTVTTITATDNDKGDDGKITYSITGGNADGKFTINPSTGAILLASSLDYEQHTGYVLYIRATDGGTPAKTGSATVTVSVNDVSDEKPTCTTNVLSTTVNEPGTVNANVVKLSCTDRDAIDTLSYSISSGNSDGKFAIDNTGQIKLAATLDYDGGVTSYALIVQVKDPTTTLEIPVNIAVGPVNEFTPSFGANPDVTFPENTAVGMTLVTYAATDNDASPHNIKRYQIASVTNSGTGLFSIDSTTGEIKLAKPLDYETATSYVIIVNAIDGGTPALTGTGTVTIQVSNVNDVRPSCTPAAHVISVNENQATGTDVIASFGCSDADSPTLTYTITSQSPSTRFILNGSPPSLRLNAALDYETADSFELEVTISDGSLSTVVYVDVAVVDVNDGGPVFGSTTYTTSVSESAVVGTSVGTYTANDPDKSTSSFGKLLYSIISGNAAKKFNINPNSGKISVIGVLNTNVTSSYSLVIQAVEQAGTNSATATVSITVTEVNDNAPTCTERAFSLTKAEQGTVGDTIIQLSCSDADGNSLTYTMTSGDSTFFEMSASSLKLKAVIDYDTVSNPQFDFVIAVSDGIHSIDVTGTLVITGVNEFSPIFTQTTYSVSRSESTTPGNLIATVTATDADKGESVSYTWVSAPTAFTLDRTSGKILLAGTLDRETTPSYSLLVQASDGSNSVTATVTITVTDVNDNSPVFNPNTYSYTIAESDPAGITVARMTATDADDPSTNNFGTITYSITSGTPTSYTTKFSIGTSTGIIVTAAVLDYEVATSYTLYVQAIDSNGAAGARSSTAVVTVNVDPENEASPIFVTIPYAATVAENVAVGTSILKVSATDTDHGNDGLIYYTMNTNANFYLGSSTGEIYLKASLDYETATSHTFDVIAHDSGTPSLSATVAVTITVTDVNDNTPTCVPFLSAFTFAENYATGSTVATLTCSDSDGTSPNKALSYAIASVNGGVSSTPFGVSSVGVITIGQNFNYEVTPSYSILVRVSDGGAPARSTTATVQVDISDYNEFSPTFSSPSYSFSVSETTAISTSVFTITATDLDTSQNITYSLNPLNSYFGIDSRSGAIILKATLNYETLGPNPFNLTVVATDSGTNPSALSSSVTVVATVLDINDVTPYFTPAVYAASISENDNVGTTVTTVTATDSDDPTVTYSLVNTFTSLFKIDTGGVITIQTKLQNYETTKSYTLVVYAVDGATPTAHTGSTTVYVQVTGYNEFSPVFSPASLTVSINENSAIGTVVADTNATDADDGSEGIIRYNISVYPAGFQDVFAIDPSTGIITVAANIDREAVVTNPLSFTITATDSGTQPGSMFGTMSLSLTVNDVNDNSPVCTKSLYSATVSEAAAASTSVATVTCTDADTDSPNKDLTYTILTGNDGNFAIGASTGVITVTSGTPTLDRETTPTYTLVVRVADGGAPSLSSTTTLTVSLIDVNDNTPVFGLASYTFSVNEDQGVGTTVGAVTATDRDSGLAGSFSFSIFSGNTDSNLAIDSNTGDIKLVGALNYETRTVYTVIIHAIDKMATVRTGTGTVTINVNDANDVTPYCSPSLQIYQVPENTAVSTNIGSVTCTDPEAGVNGNISYVISSVDGVATTSPFQINTFTGALSLATATLDFETDNLLVIIIHAIDHGSPARTGTATVNVIVTDYNEFPPVFSASSYSQSVIETTNIGSSIYKVTATDADTKNNITFSIYPNSTTFDIDPRTGEVFMISNLDYEGTQSYQLTLLAKDDGVPQKTGTSTLTVSVTNANDGKPVFNPAVYIAVISEHDSVGKTVTTVTAVDSDSPTVNYAIISGNADAVFRIEPSGVIAIDSVTNLNYDSATKSYSLVVRASDGTNTGTATVAIAVSNYNDNTPVFATTSSTQTLAENTASGTNVVTVTATDADHGDDGKISYSITSGNAAGLFAINPSTGVVSLVGALDMESTQSFVITITATDGGTNPGPLSATYILTVQVSDVNDVTPTCTSSLYSANIAESVVIGTSAAQLTCTDGDFSSPNNVISTYNIVSGNTNGDFTISNTSLVTNVNLLDREITASYTLVIQVIDKGTPPRTATTTLVINILDVNDITPSFGANPYHMSKAESAAIGDVVGSVTATDGDKDNAGKVTYVITSGNVDNKFGIDPSSGEIKVVDTLDFETATAKPYVLVIEGRDGGTPSRTGTTTVSLTVTDVNDNVPACTPALRTVEFSESTPGSTSIAKLSCTDADSTTNAALTYSVFSVNGDTTSTLFNVDATGDVTTAASTTLNYESVKSYTVLIRVKDGGTPSLSFTATVKLEVTDVNEAAPVFQSTPYTQNVVESTAVGTNVYVVTATDSDGANVVTYRINPSNNYFEIDPLTGRIYTISTIDYDILALKNISVTVEAADSGIPRMTSTATVVFTVINVNDGVPTFNPGVYSATVSETAAQGTTVTTVTVTDIDDTSFTFSFAGGNSDNVFRIDSTGKIIVNDTSNLDYDTRAKNYVLIARAVDTGSNTATATVAITVTNVNEFTPTLASTSNVVNVAENTAIGSVIDDVNVTDADAGADGEITYSITNNGSGLFTINPTSGLVATSGNLDRETQSTYVITVLATDAGTNPSAKTATYTLTVSITDVNDVTPRFSKTLYTASIAEDAALTTSVTDVTCTDLDASSPNNVIVAYNITGGNTGGVFSILANGRVQLVAALDRETLANYKLIIEAKDGGTPSLTATTTLSITVLDANDNSPVFVGSPYNTNQREDIPLGTTVQTVVATDNDIGAYGTLTFRIASGDVDAKFTIDSTSGAIILTKNLDFENATANPYTLVIHAVDGDTVSPKTGTATVMFTIQDTNDNPPVCNPFLNTATAAENTALPTTLLTLSCTDKDSGTNAALTYALSTVNGVSGSTQFAVDTSGAVRVVTALDYETTQSFSILITVTDGGTPSNTVTATVNLAVTDVNDNTPVFSGVPYSKNVIENTAVGSSVFQVTATDADVKNTIVYSLKTPMTNFEVDPHTGKIILKAAVDYETATNPYEVIVVATDDGTNPSARSSSATVTITVTNFNDGTPEFVPGVYAVSLSENTGNGVTVVTVTVVDADSSTFTYGIDSGNSDNIFGITGTTGTAYITVVDRTNLDYESTDKSYSLVIRATDSGGLFGTATVDIAVLPYNEFTPTFVPSSSTQSVSENAALGTTVYDIDATDADNGTDGVIVYSIASGANGFFAINPVTGVVTVSGSLDRETTSSYTLKVIAADKGTNPGSLTATYTLTVTVTDVNDVTPVCSSSLYSVSMMENAPIATSVAQLTCTDGDASAPNNVISSYTIFSGNAGGEFVISSSGEVTTTVTFDREIKASYELGIRVVDSGTSPLALSTTTTLTITLTDVNDNSPVFVLNPYNLNQNENIAIGTVIGTVNATDADIGLAGSVSYSIFSGNSAGKFAMDKSTGNIKLVSALDYETATNYTLVVHAVDKQATFLTGSTTVSVTVNAINDNAPVCAAALFTGSVSENSAVGTSVATVSCTDADVAVGNIITYSITSGNTEFVVDSNSGVLTTNALLDIETTPIYDVTIRASDGTFNTDVIVRVTLTDVNDKIPAFSPTGPYTKTIQENIAIGSTIYDVNATDADVTPTNFMFSITGGNTAGKFRIGASSGIIQTQAIIDRDNPLTTSYTLTIQVSDGLNTASTSIVITITDQNDNDPSCDTQTYAVTTPESTVAGTTLITPNCTDLDIAASPTLSYSIISGNSANKFQINVGTGVLTIQNALDYETTTQYTLVVNVDDQGTPSRTTTLTMIVYIDPVNEYAPAFQGTPYNTSIDEDKVAGYQVVRVSALDADTGSTHGDIRYAITNGNSAGHFSINPTTGWITVSGPLDRETTTSYSLTVSAADMRSGDAAARTSLNTFVITINDINDNYPKIDPSSYATTVNEDIRSTGANVIQVLATDADAGTAGTAGLRFSITGGNTGNPFTMDVNTGWITLTGNVDAFTQAIYILTVQVADQGTPVRSSSTIVTIEIVAVNEHAPTFSVSGTTVTLSESETVGNSIYQAAGSDMDTGSFAVLRYFIKSGNVDNSFTINLFDGIVRVANKLDFDTPPTQYSLVIIVQDTEQSTAATRTATMTLTVSLTDVNDITPAFIMSTYSANLNENVAIGTSVISVSATDGDSGSNGVITYSIVSGTGSTNFTIGASTGVISTSTTINYESLTTYDLVIRAADGGTPSLSSSCVVRINVVDLNDNTPTFAVNNVAIAISEATAVLTTVATVKATDADSAANNNNVIVYSISPTSNKFTIDGTSGAITVTNSLDREMTPSYTLTILATDQGTLTRNTGTATYTIVITDENDNNPVVSGTYDKTISEDSSINTIVYNITATDADANENRVLTYSITSGNTNGDFYIDTGSGLIQVKKTLDRERTNQYLLEVSIHDNGVPPRSATVTATVTISDVNDNMPIFQPSPINVYTFNVSENVPIGTSVNRVNATDADTGVNGAVTYAVAYTIRGNNTHFVLNPSSGVITTAATLDRETQDTYVFVVRALDGGTNTLTSTATVTIIIDDFNDNIPSFSQSLYTATVRENQPVGTSILTVVISDLDAGLNEDIVLSITNTTASFYIGANSSNFILYVKSSLDRETFTSISFVLTATDQGTPPLSFTTSIIITVGDENDNPPVFAPTFYNAEIAYNDNCQTTVTTISATDKDDGINSVITYYTTQNNQPHLFSLDSTSGDIIMVANAAANTGYKLYAAARDSGSPSLSSSTGATVRMDTYDPSKVVLNYYMNISKTSYLGMEATFLNRLTTLYRITYDKALTRRWCVVQRTSSSCTVRIYVIKNNNDTDEVGEIDTDKEYLTMDEAYAVTAADDAGTPAAAITGIGYSSFAITKVEKYVPDPEVVVSTPWIKTTAGVATVSVIAALLFVALVAAIVVAVYKIRSPPRSRNRVESSDVGDEGDKVANNQYQAKNNTIHNQPKERPREKNNISADDLYSYSFDKSHPPPPVVALPMPTATKRVPMQIGNKSIDRPKDINLFNPDMDGPTLIKKPEKLRASSPVETENVLAPRRLPPVRRHTTPKPPRPESAHNDSDFPNDVSNYMVLNREFDGRAIDPVSGRLYEYNTRTNERRWVTTPDGQQVKQLKKES